MRGNTLTIIAAGGGASNILRSLRDVKRPNIKTIALNTDMEMLKLSSADIKISLGPNICEGLGSCANPSLAEAAFYESKDLLTPHLTLGQTYCLIGCLGGGIGTACIPLIAQELSKIRVPFTAIVSIPFDFEGKVRKRKAQNALENLMQHIPNPVIVHNQNLLSVADKAATLSQMFLLANRVVGFIVDEICHIMGSSLIVLPPNEMASLVRSAGIIVDSALLDLKSRIIHCTKIEQSLDAFHVIIPEDNKDLLKAIYLKPDKVRLITPRKFEELLFELYSLIGFRVELTKTSRDGGADLLVWSSAPIFGRDFLTIVQAKKYDGRRKVSSTDIRDLAGAQFVFNAQRAQCITTSRYSNDAVSIAQKLDIDLGVFHKLLELYRPYFV